MAITPSIRNWQIADLEKALADAFDGPDAAPLTIGALATSPEAWPHLTFEPHPTASRLSFRTNAEDSGQR